MKRIFNYLKEKVMHVIGIVGSAIAQMARDEYQKEQTKLAESTRNASYIYENPERSYADRIYSALYTVGPQSRRELSILLNTDPSSLCAALKSMTKCGEVLADATKVCQYTGKEVILYRPSSLYLGEGVVSAVGGM